MFGGINHSPPLRHFISNIILNIYDSIKHAKAVKITLSHYRDRKLAKVSLWGLGSVEPWTGPCFCAGCWRCSSHARPSECPTCPASTCWGFWEWCWWRSAGSCVRGQWASCRTATGTSRCSSPRTHRTGRASTCVIWTAGTTWWLWVSGSRQTLVYLCSFVMILRRDKRRSW